MIRIALVAALLLGAAACSSEGETPDVSVVTTVNAPPASECDGSAPSASDVAACLEAAASTTTSTAPPLTLTTVPNTVAGASTTVPAAPPVTCGPDPDETHPPPCD